MKSRWSIPALGAFFVVIALVVSGCGSSGLPSGAVASVAGNPISKRALDHWLYIDEKSQSASEPGEPVIVPNDPPGFSTCITQVRADFTQYKTTPSKTIQGLCSKLFTQLNQSVLGFLIEAYQYQAEAHKLGITVTNAEVQKQVAQAKKTEFKGSNTAYQQYLKESGYTAQDVSYRLRVVALYKKLAARHTKKVTTADIASYYAAHKSTFGSPESRNMRIVLAKTASQAKAALAALKHGTSWDVVAKKYSTDPTTKDKGGLLTDVTAGQQDATLSKAAFAAPLNKLEGPIKGEFGYYLVQVIKITPAVQESLKKVTPQIKSTLTETNETATQTAVNAVVKKDFGARTLCAKEYSISLCHGYKAPVTSSTTASGATAPATTPATTATTSATGASTTSTGSAGSSTATTSSSSTQ